MKQHPAICYLCGSEAIEISDFNVRSRDIVIQCSGKCKPYALPPISLITFFNRPDGKQLSDDGKKKLIDFLEDKYEGHPIRLSPRTIRIVAGDRLE